MSLLLTGIGAAASIGGGIVGAIGRGRQSSAEQNLLRQQRKSLKRQIGQTERMFELEGAQFERGTESFLSTQKQRVGLSGIRAEGSPLMQMIESEELIQQDREMMQLQQEMTLGSMRDELRGVKTAQRQSRRDAPLHMASSILGGLSNAAQPTERLWRASK